MYFLSTPNSHLSSHILGGEMADFQKFINPDDTRTLLTRMIRSKSLNPPGDVRECAVIVAEELKARGLSAEIIEDKPGVANVVSHLKGEESGKTMIWNGHFDVVPPGEDWERDPFGGEYKDGFVYGRGTSDMKSGVAAMIVALGALKKAGSPFKGRIVFQAVGDEETGSDAGTLCMIRRKIGAGADLRWFPNLLISVWSLATAVCAGWRLL